MLSETDPTRWASGYDFPAVKEGKVVLDSFATGTPKGMNGFVFNTRRPQLRGSEGARGADLFPRFRVAQQQSLLRPVPAHRQLLSGLGAFRARSPGKRCGEGAACALSRRRAPRGVDGTYMPPKSDGSGQDRAMLGKGVELLREAGYETRDGKMVKAATGEPLSYRVPGADARPGAPRARLPALARDRGHRL